MTAAAHSALGCSTCASDPGSARCACKPSFALMYSDSNPIHYASPDTVRVGPYRLLWQIALACVRAATHRQLYKAVRTWCAYLAEPQSISMELSPCRSSGRVLLGFDGLANLTVPGFSNQLSPAEPSVGMPEAYPMPGETSPRFVLPQTPAPAAKKPEHARDGSLTERGTQLVIGNLEAAEMFEQSDETSHAVNSQGPRMPARICSRRSQQKTLKPVSPPDG